MIADFSSVHFTRTLVVGTRGSALARWQTEHVIGLLKKRAPDLQIEVRTYKTEGDKDQLRALSDFGGLGVFTREIEQALLAHEIDLAVHSLKDLPTDLTPGLALAAIPPREDPRDCVVSRHGAGLSALPLSPVIGTSSARRTGQVRMLRPDCRIAALRGNVDTRLRKAAGADYDAVILAAAGIIRLGRATEITEYLPLDQVLPDPGQGALAIEIRADDESLARLLASLDHPDTRAAVTAERAFLRGLGGGCRMPIGAHSEVISSQLRLRGIVTSLDGASAVRGELEGLPAEAEELGANLASLLLEQGAAEILRGETPVQSARPLEGRRIVITRAAEQSASLVERLRVLGAVPLEYPTIEIAPLEDFGELDAALTRAAEHDWVIFTSVNGVRAVAERLTALGLRLSALSQARIGAIGTATARELQARGIKVDFLPSRFLGEQVGRELPIQAGQSALLLRADIASPALADILRERGVQVTNVDAYRTVPAKGAPADFENVDGITFTSSSTVRNLAAGVPATTAVFSIGPVTSATARDLGLRVDAEAREHTIDGLVEAIVRYYSPDVNSNSEDKHA